KALVAEDDNHTRRAIVEILQGEGWEVTAVADGRGAVSAFRETRPDLVCLDIMMPILSGFDACREIRAIDRGVPLLFISAKSEEIDKVLGLELGADDFIQKPFGVREFLARVAAVLRRSVRGAEDRGLDPPDLDGLGPFRFGPWTIRPRELRAQRLDGSAFAGSTGAGRVIDLSRREARILALLYFRVGEVVDRDEFFRLCWEFDNPPVSRTLDQHMVALRRKLEENPAEPRLIRTVQGAGYRYEKE
ncbi:MAG: response regulator transcription factor, partial [Treponemataceae bacterium]